jgi:hypothetical protein
VLEKLAYQSPELIWGLCARGIGLVFLVAFVSLTHQLLPIAGHAGITPVAELMRAMRRDFKLRRCLVYFPSLLWIDSGDRTLRALPWLGVVASCGVIIGGPYTPWSFACCYVLYLSLDRAVVLVYPWDSLLFEAGFWAMFLPSLHVLPDLTVSAAPLPALAWVYRLLVFRVMFGFGKQKFLGSTRSDSGFLKGFYIRQPLPSVLGWFAHKLPMPIHKLALFAMFVIEIPLSFAWLAPGTWSAVAALGTIGLMLAIWATGNFGYFNLLTIALCSVGFDATTASAFSLTRMFSLAQPPAQLCLHALIALHTIGAVCSLPWNSWCSFTWTLWPFWRRVRPRFLTWPIDCLRILQPLRWLHAYGVFPPRSAPAVRLAPVLEVSWDEQHWQELRHRYAPTNEQHAPSYCAPHHARVDQAIVYESVGFNETSALRGLSGRWDPYGYGKVSGAQRLVQSVLKGTADTELCFATTFDPARLPPMAARVRLHMLEPTSSAELARSGRWWTRTLIGPHFPIMRLGQPLWDEPVPPPELWHFEDLIWLRRSKLGPLLERARRGEDPHRLVLLEGDGLEQVDVDRLWNDFLPALPTRTHADWTSLRDSVEQIRKRYERAQLYRFERLIGRYSALLLARCEALFLEGGVRALLGWSKARLPAKSHYHLGLLTHHIIARGRVHYDATFSEPIHAARELEQMTMQSGATLSALFRYESMVHHSQKLRLLESQLAQDGRPKLGTRQARLMNWANGIAQRLWGCLEMIEFLRTQFLSERDVLDIPERWPRFALARDGEIRRLPLTAALSDRDAASAPPPIA